MQVEMVYDLDEISFFYTRGHVWPGFFCTAVFQESEGEYAPELPNVEHGYLVASLRRDPDGGLDVRRVGKDFPNAFPVTLYDCDEMRVLDPARDDAPQPFKVIFNKDHNQPNIVYLSGHLPYSSWDKWRGDLHPDFLEGFTEEKMTHCWLGPIIPGLGHVWVSSVPRANFRPVTAFIREVAP